MTIPSTSVYEGLHVLGHGGLSSVSLARSSRTGRLVAIKSPLSELGYERIAEDLLRHEAEVLTAVRHDGIANLIEVDRLVGGRPCLVLEYVRGCSLALVPLPAPISLIVPVAVDLSTVLSHVHAKGYLHNDVKAENVIIEHRFRSLRARLIDFGIALELGRKSVADSQLLGTPRSMAPEQIARLPLDDRADVWSLGVLIYELLTGRAPFAHGQTSPRDIFAAILSEAPAPMPEHIPVVFRELLTLCLQKDRGLRPTMEHVRQILGAVIGAANTTTADRLGGRAYPRRLLFSTRRHSPSNRPGRGFRQA